MKNQRGVLGAGFVFSLVVFAHSVCANQEGGTVVSGAARFDRQPGRLTINQGSDRLIINWRDFSIAAGETTKFVQPSAHSAALNRVMSGNPSRIFGNLEANGKVFLINPNGVLVGKGGVPKRGLSTAKVRGECPFGGVRRCTCGRTPSGVRRTAAVHQGCSVDDGRRCPV